MNMITSEEIFEEMIKRGWKAKFPSARSLRREYEYFDSAVPAKERKEGVSWFRNKAALVAYGRKLLSTEKADRVPSPFAASTTTAPDPVPSAPPQSEVPSTAAPPSEVSSAAAPPPSAPSTAATHPRSEAPVEPAPATVNSAPATSPRAMTAPSTPRQSPDPSIVGSTPASTVPLTTTPSSTPVPTAAPSTAQRRQNPGKRKRRERSPSPQQSHGRVSPHDELNHGVDEVHEFLSSDGGSDDDDDADGFVLVDRRPENSNVSNQSEDQLGVDDLLTATGEFSKKEMAAMATSGWKRQTGVHQMQPDLHNDVASPSRAASAAAASGNLLDLFFFLPRAFWLDVAQQANLYEVQSRFSVATRRLERQLSRLARDGVILTPASRQAREQGILQELAQFQAIGAHEILHFVGLLIARVISPQRRKIADHFVKHRRGVVRVGTWSQVMSKRRFEEINRNLHFTDNKDPLAKVDRIWKIRPVIDCLQKTFAAGMEIGRWVSFDEMVIPSRSSMNTARIYIKNKPHKYGTKLFAICCAVTHYCSRIEMYCGPRKGATSSETKGGPIAVVRNLNALWPAPDKTKKRIVVMDREYTSVSLAIQLERMGFYSVGTINPLRQGYPKDLRGANVSEMVRGQHKILVNKKHKNVVATVWVDKRPNQTGVRETVPCPQLVSDYNRYMAGVDSHDQLRLQRYSIQMTHRSKKYYKTLFYGLLDMAIVNAFVIHRVHAERIGEVPMSHADFLELLHEELINVSPADFNDNEPPMPSSSGIRVSAAPVDARIPRDPSQPSHRLVKSADKNAKGYIIGRTCKVCSVLTPRQDGQRFRVKESKWHCDTCRHGSRVVYLCPDARHIDSGDMRSCFQIWHEAWANGLAIPATAPVQIRFRRTKAQLESASAPEESKREENSSDENT